MREDNNIPKGWVETKLGNHLKIGRGSSPRPIHKYISTEGIPWVKIADATASNNKYIEKTNEFIIEEGRSTSVKHGDLIVSNSATPGIPKFMAIDACVHDGWLVFSEYNGIDKLYLYYFFLFFRRELNHSATGTVFKNLKTDIVRNVELLLPPKEEQQAIASILTSFDDKIELLQAQNETLEATAQTIFKEWFGKYQVGDKLPEGWREGKIKDIGKVICGKTPSKSRSDYYGNDVPFIKIPDMHHNIFVLRTSDNLTQLGANSQLNKTIPANSICVSCIATVGLVSMTTQSSQTNQQINSIVPYENTYREYLYFTLKKMNSHLNDLGSGGTATLNVNTNTFSNIEIIMPEVDILNKFHIIQKTLFDKILSNMKQIQTLQATRDTLLPKLMSGKVRVDEFRE